MTAIHTRAEQFEQLDPAVAERWSKFAARSILTDNVSGG